MAWNPEPEVADCREIAQRRGWSQVIVVGIDPANNSFKVSSYGATKELCAEAALINQAIHALVASGGDLMLQARKQVLAELAVEFKKQFDASENYTARRTWLEARNLINRLES